MSRTSPYGSEELWTKARLFINRAMDEAAPFEEEAAFWACCALELLGKSALARLNPLLIAIPTDDGHSLLVAAGAIEDTDKFMTVPAKAVWARCGRVFRKFSTEKARELSIGRNAYIHSAAIGFDNIPADAWWPRFWAQANVLIIRCGHTIEDFVGPARSTTVHEHLDADKANQDHKLKSLLADARTKRHLYETDELNGRMLREWDRYAAIVRDYDHSAAVTCPACGKTGTIGGSEVVDRDVDTSHLDYYEDGFANALVTLTVGTDEFRCDHCHLVLDDLDLVDRAGLPPTFEAEGDFEDVADLYEEEYNNE